MYPFSQLGEIWQAVYASIGNAFSASSTELWFKEIRLVYLDNTLALMTIPSDFKKQILDTKFPDVLKEHFYNCLGFEVETELISGITTQITNEEEARLIYENYIENKRKSDFEESQKQMGRAVKVISADKKSNSYYTFENFIQGDSNKFAYAACYAIAHNDEVTYNPLFIHGKSGLGKTHLMYAIINTLLKRNPDLKVIYIKGEEFTNTLVEAIKNGTTDKFRERYRTADILLVDDIQFIAGKNATQDEFFHTFNILYESQKQIIVTCDRPIHEMRNLVERIRTRLEWGLSADITPPDKELRVAIIKKKAEESNLPLTDEIIEYMAEKLKDNIRLIEGGIKKLSAIRFIMGRELNLITVKQQIADLVPTEEPLTVKIDKIILQVCEKYNISKETIVGKKRTAHIVTARHVCMYALREAIEMTYTDIAKIFSCHHTSVMAAMEKLEREKSTDKEFADELNSLIKDLKESIA